MSDYTRASLELLYNVSRELTSALDLHTVLTRVLFLSTSNVQAERGTVIVLDDHLRPVDAAIVVESRLIPSTVEGVKATLEQGLAGWVLRERQPALVPRHPEDTRWLRRPDDAIERSGAKSAICVPILVREALVGVLTLVHATPNSFNMNTWRCSKPLRTRPGSRFIMHGYTKPSRRPTGATMSCSKTASTLSWSPAWKGKSRRSICRPRRSAGVL